MLVCEVYAPSMKNIAIGYLLFFFNAYLASSSAFGKYFVPLEFLEIRHYTLAPWWVNSPSPVNPFNAILSILICNMVQKIGTIQILVYLAIVFTNDYVQIVY